MSPLKAILWSVLCSAIVGVVSCSPSSPQVGSQTNWLRSCDGAEDCDGLECLCGVCTTRCTDTMECEVGACVAATDEGAVALCDGKPLGDRLCLSRCDDDASCPGASSCVAGVCSPLAEAEARVDVDPEVRHQALVGFGASLAFSEEAIVGFEDKAALYDVMFVESGFDVIRLRNRFEGDNPGDLQPVLEIITEAERRLGRAPTLFMTSGSPPAALKANGNRYCENADPLCTLARNEDGDFDYEGFGEYWRASLEAYAELGIRPEFVSLQNNTDWIPPGENGPEACRFLPEEGTMTMNTPDGEVDAEFPGFTRALEAVRSATSSLDADYSFTAAEAGSPIMVARYVDPLNEEDYGAIAFHLFGFKANDVALDQLERLRALGERGGKPVIQSEMDARGLDAAILTHYTLTVANAAAYLQQGFVNATLDEASSVPIGALDGTIVKLPTYHALSHFALRTDPGWRRVDALMDSSDVLSSAWLSPNEEALTIVLINPGDSTVAVEVAAPAPFDARLNEARVSRTVFDGTERSAELGTLPRNRVVRLPGQGIVTIAIGDAS